MMLYLQLFWEFFKTGLFAVGGGLATLPFLQDMADRTGWFTRAQLADMLAVSESTPGPIGVNMATYVGFSTGGVGGALIATLGLITPSVIVILIVAAFLKAFRRVLRPAPRLYRAGGGGGHLRGAHRHGEHRSGGPGILQLEGHRFGRRTAGTDPLGQIHQKPAPHLVHSGQRRCGRRVPILSGIQKEPACGRLLFRALRPAFACAGRGRTIRRSAVHPGLDSRSALWYNAVKVI